ncbi:MAG: hypothetical protein HC799_15175 [Limnothrix sp. RL_2_0]|nr:hypothetical protein [Limnothrix sp. RL_2_0]
MGKPSLNILILGDKLRRSPLMEYLPDLQHWSVTSQQCRDLPADLSPYNLCICG